jgi:hypothetical protein
MRTHESLRLLQLTHPRASAPNDVQSLRQQKRSERDIVRAKRLIDSRELIDCRARFTRGSRSAQSVFQSASQELGRGSLRSCTRRASRANERPVEIAGASGDESRFHEKLALRNRILERLFGQLLEGFSKFRIGAERLRRPPAQLEGRPMLWIVGKHSASVLERG